MTAVPIPTDLDACFAHLQRGVAIDRSRGILARAELFAACRRTLADALPEWLEVACRSKRIAERSPAVADEWATGPLPVARHLRLLEATARTLARGHLPRLVDVGPDRVRATPRGAFDRLALPGYHAVVELEPARDRQVPWPTGGQGVHVVLGAGNVASTPLCDALHAIATRGASVLLKLSPLHAPLLPVFIRALRPLVDADLLAIVVGDGDLGARALHHPAAVAWHLTGAPSTLRTLLADRELAQRTWTAELGNVTPVVLLPGTFAARVLRAAASQIAAWCAQNAGCNCATPRLLLTARGWPQRREFLALLAAAFAALPPREPFHPGARERFARFAARPAPDGPLPFVLRTDVDLAAEPHLAAEESFAPVLVEIALEGDGALAFADRAAALLAERAYGALAAQIVMPPRTEPMLEAALATLIARLPHGTIAINTWAAINYALMATPWGAGAGAQGSHCGRGWQHGTLCLAAPRRTIVRGPLRGLPPPPFLPQRSSTALVAALTRVHLRADPTTWLQLAAAAFAHRWP